jgi:acylphosphatase
MAAPIGQYIYITGRVQGVGYRVSLCQQAMIEGIVGGCRNGDTGEVEAWLYGSADAVKRLALWCYTGPPFAQVKAVHLSEIPLPATWPDTFEIWQ